jgi:hypothetical protein
MSASLLCPLRPAAVPAPEHGQGQGSTFRSSADPTRRRRREARHTVDGGDGDREPVFKGAPRTISSATATAFVVVSGTMSTTLRSPHDATPTPAKASMIGVRDVIGNEPGMTNGDPGYSVSRENELDFGEGLRPVRSLAPEVEVRLVEKHRPRRQEGEASAGDRPSRRRCPVTASADGSKQLSRITSSRSASQMIAALAQATRPRRCWPKILSSARGVRAVATTGGAPRPVSLSSTDALQPAVWAGGQVSTTPQN